MIFIGSKTSEMATVGRLGTAKRREKNKKERERHCLIPEH